VETNTPLFLVPVNIFVPLDVIAKIPISANLLFIGTRDEISFAGRKTLSSVPAIIIFPLIVKEDKL